jgi:single-stranded DNA-binding protein
MWINEARVGGKLIKKFEAKETSNGRFILFTVHSSKEKKQQYTPCIAFGDLVQLIEDIQPDSYVTIEGEISTKAYDNPKTGVKEYRTSVIAHRVTVG